MDWSLYNCHLTYIFICSSFKPIVLTQYPFAQKCLPQYCFFNSRCILNTLTALLPFKNPTTSEIEYFGGIDKTKCIWSTSTLPANISNCFHSYNCLIISHTILAIFPFKILNRYFDTIQYGNCISIRHVLIS